MSEPILLSEVKREESTWKLVNPFLPFIRCFLLVVLLLIFMRDKQFHNFFNITSYSYINYI